MTPATERALAGACLAALLVPAAAVAQGAGGPLTGEVTNVVNWVVALAKILAVIFVIGGCALLATGRWAIAGLAGIALGVMGMAKADQIVAYFIS